MRTKSVLGTDAYKISMSEAGAPLRTETFYYSHRRGGAKGWHYMPVDVNKFVQDLLPVPTEEDYTFLKQHNYEAGAGTRKAFTMQQDLKVLGVPKGAWFYNREAAFSATGASTLASWLEPKTLQLHFRIQVATAYLVNDPSFASKIRYVTCQREKEIIEETIDSVAMNGNVSKRYEIEVCSQRYYDTVFARAKQLVATVGGNPDRIFEVGMRGVSCTEQHEIALRAIKDAGILRTSDMELARSLGMIPVGTMGHEHPQRTGGDYQAFTGMRDRFPGFLFYLPDTFDTLRSGIPAALRALAEDPGRQSGIRFDSEEGIRGHYMYTVVRAREMGIDPILALESGSNLQLTEEFEELRKQIKWAEDRQCYGFGGFLNATSWPSFNRDDVSAVWKISQSGSRATKKYGDESGGAKESIPGRPVIWRPKPAVSSEIVGYVYQEGEVNHDPDTFLLSGKETTSPLYPGHVGRLVYSPETKKLIAECDALKKRILEEC